MKHTTYILFLSLALISCGKKGSVEYSTSPQVEEISDPNAFPSVVLVSLPRGGGICTGTFISPSAVLTAAHCTKSAGTYRIFSSFGTFSTSVKEVLGPGVLEDPEDIAILILSSPVAKRASGQVSIVSTATSTGEQIRIVGYGCNNLDTKRGAGAKRAGTNWVAGVGDYIELTTPFSADTQSHSILGPKDRAGSCFGDSGGPMFRTEGNGNQLVGVTHAGGTNGEYIQSQYINIGRSSIVSFLRSVDSSYSLGIFDVCNSSDSIQGPPCGPQSASGSIVDFLKQILAKVTFWIKMWF